MTHTLVLGIGNRARGDDGFGAAVLARLRQKLEETGRHPASELELRWAGLAGLELLLDFEGRECVFVVDAVRMGTTPGSHRRITAQHLLDAAVDQGTLHGFGLPMALRLAEALGVLPREFWLFGVEPASLEHEEGLSPVVQAAVAPVTDQLLAEFEARGLLHRNVAR